MNCAQARDLIPLDIYSEMDAGLAGDLAAHLDACPACRNDRAELQATRTALDAAVNPEVEVDTAAIERAAVTSQHRALRRWKRVAIAAGALAAGLIAILLIRPEVQLGGGALVVRWGERPTEPRRETVSIVHVPVPAVRDVDLEERLRILSDLVRALRDDLETGDRSRRDELNVLVARLELLRIQSQQRWDETRRDVKALYTAQFGGKLEGDRQ
jgi:hypothetical protein